MMPPKRKKWTEAEEKTLIDKYGEMVCDGSLAKMRTREKKFRPITCYVNSMHHVLNPIAYPWQWTWKDVSTKVQNMRHQYLLVKQKIKKPDSAVDNSGGDSNMEEYDWMEGITHWSNFLRYKDVFGDVSVATAATTTASSDLMGISNVERENSGQFGMDVMEFTNMGHSGDGDFTVGIDGVENGVIGLEFGYDGDKLEGNYDNNDRMMKEDGDDGFVYEEVEHKVPILKRKKKKTKRKAMKKKAWGFLVNQLGQLKEMEARFEQREVERERERQRMENLKMELDQKWEKTWELSEKDRIERGMDREKLRGRKIQEWEAMEKESREMENRRREEELDIEREWEERMNKRRSEWKNRIDGMLSQHRAEMGQIQTRILQEQQNLTSQLLGIVSQWTAHPAGLSDHTSASNHYLSQMMQNLHHVSDLVHDDTRVEGDNQDDQFIVDG